jgi:hypothetical protein
MSVLTVTYLSLPLTYQIFNRGMTFKNSIGISAGDVDYRNFVVMQSAISGRAAHAPFRFIIQTDSLW